MDGDGAERARLGGLLVVMRSGAIVGPAGEPDERPESRARLQPSVRPGLAHWRGGPGTVTGVTGRKKMKEGWVGWGSEVRRATGVQGGRQPEGHLQRALAWFADPGRLWKNREWFNQEPCRMFTRWVRRVVTLLLTDVCSRVVTREIVGRSLVNEGRGELLTDRLVQLLLASALWASSDCVSVFDPVGSCFIGTGSASSAGQGSAVLLKSSVNDAYDAAGVAISGPGRRRCQVRHSGLSESVCDYRVRIGDHGHAFLIVV